VETENSWGAGIKRGCGRLSWIHYACDVLLGGKDYGSLLALFEAALRPPQA
jgi:hypothetical protein